MVASHGLRNFVTNTYLGLYVTADMTFVANHVLPMMLNGDVERIHARQPTNRDLRWFGHEINQSWLIWEQLAGDEYDDVFYRGQLMAMADGFAKTYPQILVGLIAVIDTALATHFQTTSPQINNESEYPRVIPRGLRHLRIERLEDITPDILHRILCADPWQSWMELLRAQDQRSRRAIATLDPACGRLREVIGEISFRRAAPKKREIKLARRSIRRSITMIDRLFGRATLRAFLASYPTVGRQHAPIVVQGKNYDYQLTMQPGLHHGTVEMNTGAPSIWTMVYNKSGQFLAEICLYYDNTPVLDALISTILNVRNEATEIEVLQAAHIMLATKAFYHDPLLPHLKGLHDPTDTPVLTANIRQYAEALTGENARVRKLLVHRHLPTVFRIFLDIMRPPPHYLKALQASAQYTGWDLAGGDPKPTALLQDMRRILVG
jgi:hypothetical protein